MRVRLNAVDSHYAKQIGRRFNRSNSNACGIALREYAHAHLGIEPAPDDAEIDDAVAGPSMLALHVKPGLRAAVQAFAEREDRSLSAALRILIKQALRANGILPATKGQ
jgi:hypothetical protein